MPFPRDSSPWLRALLAAAATLAISCSDLVFLGSECPGCPRPLDSGSRDAEPQSSDETSAEDSGWTMPEPFADGDVGGGVPSPSLGIQNPSFERNGGFDGDVLLSNLVYDALPVAPVDYVFQELPSWFTCIPFMVTTLSKVPTSSNGTTVTSYGDYLSFAVSVPPAPAVRQDLGAPMVVGASYTIRLKVMGRNDAGARLFVQVNGNSDQCSAGTVLGRSPPVPASETWTTTSITFVSDKGYEQLVLSARYEGSVPGLNTRLLVDDLEQVAQSHDDAGTL